MHSLIWFRRDLRITDNAALHHAAEAGQPLIALFVVTPGQWKQHDDCPGKVAFWLNNLQSLAESLDELNIPLRVASCDTFEEVPEVVVDTCREFECDQVFFNREYEVNERDRDAAVVKACAQQRISCARFHDRVVVPPREISTQQEKFYSVFTPYRKVWDTVFDAYSEPWPTPEPQSEIKVKSSDVPQQVAGFESPPEWLKRYPAGEEEAQRRLESFADRMDRYADDRDIPSVEGTSGLSPYLAAGVISPRQCLSVARPAAQPGSNDDPSGATVWVSELAWRDFYNHVLVGYPRVSKHRPFKQKTEDIPWRDDDDDFQAWCDGQTGYPIVDAGMRQLNQTGWMHNRLRMVTAMFLTKNLLIDWRMGERYFMQHLIDGDLAANNGGWQWSASTGTDAVPYFRIFNPFSQSKRFDPDGDFIKQLCPELEPVPKSALHDPKKLAAAIEKHDIDYPEMVVDYKPGRQRALDAFKSLND